MDSLHAIGFYVSAALAVVGGLVLAFLHGHRRRGMALAASGLGVVGLYASLSAGFAGAVALVCYAGCAWLIARPDYRSVELVMGDRWRQVGAVGAAALLGVLAYSAYRGTFRLGIFRGDAFDGVAVARLLFAHDALATEAVAALALAGLVGAAAAWRRERIRDERAREEQTRQERARAR